MSRLREKTASGEGGFTLLELMVAITLMTVASVTLAQGLYGAMFSLQVINTRGAMTDLAVADMEALRARPFNEVAVDLADPDRVSQYPSGEFDGHPAVVVDPSAADEPAGDDVPATADLPDAVEEVPASTVNAIRVPEHTIIRHITWTDPSDRSTEKLKRIHVEVRWVERTQQRSTSLSSVLYPGGKGPPIPDTTPTALFTITPQTPPGCAVAGSTSFHFNASASSGNNLTYEWDWEGDGTFDFTSGISTADHVYSTPGIKTILLRVTSGDTPPVQSPLANGEVTVIADLTDEDDVIPEASFTIGPDPLGLGIAEGSAPLDVFVDGNGSFDPDGSTPLTYRWRWGDGSPDDFSGAVTTHQYTTSGSYTARLFVTDATCQESLAATRSVTVTAPVCDFVTPPDPPTDKNLIYNPAGSSTPNVITANLSNNKAVDRSFRFVAYTTAVCTGMTATIGLSNGTFAALAGDGWTQGTLGGVKAWELDKDCPANAQFGNSNTSALFTAVGGSNPTGPSISITIVHV